MFKKRAVSLLRYCSVLGNRTITVALVTTAILACSVVLAFTLRFGALPEFALFVRVSFVVISLRLVAFRYFNCLRGWWRYTSILEAVAVSKAIAIVSVVVLVFAVFRIIPSMPFSFYGVEFICAELMILGARASARIVAQMQAEAGVLPKKTIALVGAGWAARHIERELRFSNSEFNVVTVVDDDSTKQGLSLGKVKVSGDVDQIPAIAKDVHIDEVWIAVPSASDSEMQRFVEICRHAGIKHRTLPPMNELVDKHLVSQIREVRLEDLLGRAPVLHEVGAARELFEGQTVMVTGAAGSIGSELCKQLIKAGPAKIICLDQSETGLFHLEMKHRSYDFKGDIVYAVADVLDTPHLNKLLHEFKVEIIFHAAAYKHVPMMESNIYAAVNNNVFALVRLLDAAQESGVTKFVMISSDKAVNPTNVMGTTKRVCELIIAARPPSLMTCSSVRFGNVLGSNGSVVPVFQEQIRNNAEVTITHPDIKRYFMTIPEAVSLVLQAFAVGEHGDILVLDMGEPVRIIDMARRLIALSGKTEGEVKIRFTGLRNGEKLKEELFYESEEVWPTECAKVMRTKSQIQGWQDLTSQLNQLEFAMYSGDESMMRAKLHQIVPEYIYREQNKTIAELYEYPKARAAQAD